MVSLSLVPKALSSDLSLSVLEELKDVSPRVAGRPMEKIMCKYNRNITMYKYHTSGYEFED